MRRVEAREIERGWKARQEITWQDQAFYTRGILYIYISERPSRRFTQSVEASKRRSESAGHTHIHTQTQTHRYAVSITSRVVIGRLVLL